MVTNHFPCSAITNNSTLYWGSLHPGLEWHLETVEGGPSSAALCCCYYYCLCWELPISTHSSPPSAFHHRHLLKKLIKLLSHIRCLVQMYLLCSLGISQPCRKLVICFVIAKKWQMTSEEKSYIRSMLILMEGAHEASLVLIVFLK